MTVPIRVQTNATNTTSNVGNVTCTFGSAQSQYATNLVFVKCSIAGDVTSVKDTSQNGQPSNAGYVLVASQTNGLFNEYLYAATLIAAAGAGANTVTVALSTTGLAVSVGIYEASPSFVDSFGSAAPNSANPSMTLTTQAVDTLLVAFATGDSTSGAPTAGTGFTARLTSGTSGNVLILEDQTVFANGAQTVAATGVGSTASTIMACALSTQQFLTSGTSYTPLGTGTYTVEVVGPGGNGADASAGGGAYSKGTDALTAGTAVTIQVLAPAFDTWFDGASLAASKVGAQAGGSASSTTPGAGGAAASGTGTIKYSGGAGQAGTTSTTVGGPGGGGAGGPLGTGQAGGASPSSTGGSGGGGASAGSATVGVTGSTTAGANGGLAQDGTAGGIGGAAGSPGGVGGTGSHGSGGGGGGGGVSFGTGGVGGIGGAGIEWDSAHGCGGGGGGGGGSANGPSGVGGAGGGYGGGGGGGAGTTGGNGGPPLIVLSFLPPPAAQIITNAQDGSGGIWETPRLPPSQAIENGGSGGIAGGFASQTSMGATGQVSSAGGIIVSGGVPQNQVQGSLDHTGSIIVAASSTGLPPTADLPAATRIVSPYGIDEGGAGIGLTFYPTDKTPSNYTGGDMQLGELGARRRHHHDQVRHLHAERLREDELARDGYGQQRNPRPAGLYWNVGRLPEPGSADRHVCGGRLVLRVEPRVGRHLDEWRPQGERPTKVFKVETRAWLCLGSSVVEPCIS